MDRFLDFFVYLCSFVYRVLVKAFHVNTGARAMRFMTRMTTSATALIVTLKELVNVSKTFKKLILKWSVTEI